jgi:transposase
MGSRKGQKHYTEEIKQIVVSKQREGESIHSLSRKYGISRYSIQSWCGLRPEVNRRQITPLKRGRPSSKVTSENLENKVKRLEMENELLRNFLQELERK